MSRSSISCYATYMLARLSRVRQQEHLPQTLLIWRLHNTEQEQIMYPLSPYWLRLPQSSSALVKHFPAAAKLDLLASKISKILMWTINHKNWKKNKVILDGFPAKQLGLQASKISKILLLSKKLSLCGDMKSAAGYAASFWSLRKTTISGNESICSLWRLQFVLKRAQYMSIEAITLYLGNQVQSSYVNFRMMLHSLLQISYLHKNFLWHRRVAYLIIILMAQESSVSYNNSYGIGEQCIL